MEGFVFFALGVFLLCLAGAVVWAVRFAARQWPTVLDACRQAAEFERQRLEQNERHHRANLEHGKRELDIRERELNADDPGY